MRDLRAVRRGTILGPLIAFLALIATFPVPVHGLPGLSQNQTSVPPDQQPSSGWHHFGERRPASPGSAQAGTIAGMEREMYDLINHDRSQNRSPDGERLLPLRWNDRLAAIARAHSRDMIARGYFGHVDPEGKSPGQRLKAAGIAWRSVGENIAMEQSVRIAERAFMNEPHTGMNHRTNILSSKFTEVGVGIVAGPKGQLYITQEFMRPADSQ